MIGPARPLSVGEWNFLAGEGTLGAAIAGLGIRFVYCDHGAIKGTEWYEHTNQHTQAGPQGDDTWAIERWPDYVSDCVLVLSDPVSHEHYWQKIGANGKRCTVCGVEEFIFTPEAWAEAQANIEAAKDADQRPAFARAFEVIAKAGDRARWRVGSATWEVLQADSKKATGYTAPSDAKDTLLLGLPLVIDETADPHLMVVEPADAANEAVNSSESDAAERGNA